ncbi:MAG: ABC transporter permease [Candidatus Dadabacteria bacterium]|nr:MAG: ABC transporter permease [Candidatus Dadabacteria bacterium]
MSRHLRLLEYALGVLVRRPGRNLAVLGAYAFTVAALASILFLSASLRHEARAALEGAPALVVQRQVAGRHELIPLSYADAIRDLPGVARVAPRVWGYTYDALTGANYTVLGAAGASLPSGAVEGRLPAAPGECAVGAGVAEVRALGLGDDLILVDAGNVGRGFEVVGILRPASALLTNDLVLLTEADVREFFGIPADRATDLAVAVPNPSEVNTLARKIRAARPDTRPISRAEILRTYDAAFHWRSGMLLVALLSALVAFVVLAWDRASGLGAEERREIGILKGIGWDTAEVLEAKALEALALSGTALLLGLAAAYLHVHVFGAPLLRPVLQGWSVLFPAFRPVPAVGAGDLLAVAFLSVGPYVAATVVPSWKAAVTDPDAVLRG